jgi:hypothetical protein
MQDFLENHMPDNFDVLVDDGTYAEIRDKRTGAIWGVHASGNGDSFRHKVEFEPVDLNDEANINP